MFKKKLEELNLLDDFLFTSMLTYPEIGKVFIRKILEIILGRDLGELSIYPQKIYPGIDTDRHGSRLDVYVEEEPDTEENTDIYDVEPDKNAEKGDIAALPRRTRFYNALIDVRSLKSGTDYRCLKNVTIIVITSYDPFGLNRMVYTVKRTCVEEPAMEFNDGSKTLYLYIKGTEGNPPETLKELLKYMGDTRPENAVNDTLKEIQKMVDTIKNDREVSLNYMKIFEQEQRIRERAIKEGHEEGRKEGREEGRKEGRKEGREEGRKEGREEGREEGRKEERANTEREKKRADNAEDKLKNIKEMDIAAAISSIYEFTSDRQKAKASISKKFSLESAYADELFEKYWPAH